MPEQRKNTRRGQQPADLTYGHVMPQAPEMEKAVLGALMIDTNAYLEVCDLLKPESFYEPRNQMVYEAIMRLSMEQSPVDVLTTYGGEIRGSSINGVNNSPDGFDIISIIPPPDDKPIIF